MICHSEGTKPALSCRRERLYLRSPALYFRSMLILRMLLAAFALSAVTAAPQVTSFPTEDGGLIYADLYGKGTRGVVLAHGGQFTKESWREQARALAAHGFRVLAFDFRGFGR